MNNVSILIVEDSFEWQEELDHILREYLTKENKDVRIERASSLSEVVKKINTKIFDVVILDLRLNDWDEGNFDGWNLVENLFLKTKEHGTQIIICSAFGLTEHVREGFRKYKIADYFDKKRLSEFEFSNSVQEAIKKARLLRKDP